MKPPPLYRLPLLALPLAGWVLLGHGSVRADQMVQQAAANPVSIALGSAPEWKELSPTQKKVLHPLAPHWASMDDASREKWVNVANRFQHLSPAEQQRVQERMSQWAKLPAQERGEARLRFQQSRQVGADELQQKWAAYQALSPEDRNDLTRQAKRKAKPVYLSDSMQGPREAKQAYTNKRAAPNGSPQKSNLVPNAMSGTAPAQTAVTGTMVKAGPGATTSLVSQRPSPPLHQHTGLTKITATKGFVDPITLLPKKGAQSAAMASLPSTGTPDESTSHGR